MPRVCPPASDLLVSLKASTMELFHVSVFCLPASASTSASIVSAAAGMKLQ